MPLLFCLNEKIFDIMSWNWTAWNLVYREHDLSPLNVCQLENDVIEELMSTTQIDAA